MPYRKSTLRRMTPEARKLAKLVGELQSVARRLKALVPAVQSFEMWERADKKRQARGVFCNCGIRFATLSEALPHLQEKHPETYEALKGGGDAKET